MDINEVYSNADGTVQYVEFIALAAGQTQLQLARVVARGPNGTPVTVVLDLTAPFLALGNDETFLIATEGFEAVAGFAPDFVIPNNSLIPFPSGRITFESDPTGGSLIFDGVAYGSYTGNNGTFGTPAAALPCNGRQSLTRISTSNNNSLGFAIRTARPMRNDGTNVQLTLSVGSDCNNNQSPDLCDIAVGTSTDANGNDVPDECDPPPSCRNDPESCDNGDVCDGLESCNLETGECAAGEALNCDDDDACTTDGCDAITGCTNNLLNCDDDDVCTVDHCDAVTGCFSDPLNCDDGDPCDEETCVADVGCQSTPVCTPGFTCSGGECTCSIPRGDFDGNGVLDAIDSIHQLACLQGPEGGVSTHCECADFDGDADIDLLDWAEYLAALSVPQ